MAGYRAPSIMVLLLLYGVTLMGESQSGAMARKVCPLYCLDVDFMTCKSTGTQKLAPSCNCCLAPKPCTLHLVDGTTVSCN